MKAMVLILAACGSGPPAPVPPAPVSSCALPPARATPPAPTVLALIDERQQDATTRVAAGEALQQAPGDAVDVLERVVVAASADDLAAYRPDALLSLVEAKLPRRARRAAECIARTYDAAAAAERTTHGDTHTLRFVTSIATLLHHTAQLPPPCWAVACEGAGEVCVHPTCCTGPCDPAAPYCAHRAELPTPSCPVATVSGSTVTCACR